MFKLALKLLKTLPMRFYSYLLFFAIFLTIIFCYKNYVIKNYEKEQQIEAIKSVEKVIKQTKAENEKLDNIKQKISKQKQKIDKNIKLEDNNIKKIEEVINEKIDYYNNLSF